MGKVNHGNRLLDAIPRDIYDTFQKSLKSISLLRGQVLHEPGAAIRTLHFPTDSLISITVTMPDGRIAEAGVVGNREVVGINAFMGGSETTQTTYIVQMPGDAVEIPSRPLLEAFNNNKSVRDVFLKFTQAHIAQISQNVACNRLHSLEQRYARWLLEVRERVHRDDLELTQEFASEMLGVQRPSVSLAASTLEKTGVIQGQRGVTHIKDVGGLERASCPCYEIVRKEYDRLLGSKHRPT
jgi:CRP-like cAMP-binding protein